VDIGITPSHTSVSGLINDLALVPHGAGMSAAPTGFSPLDMVLDGGFIPQELVLLGGRPGVGKTLTALQWARAAAVSDRTVAFVCYEHDEIALLGRLLVQEIAANHPEIDSTLMVSIRSAVQQLVMGIIHMGQLADVHPAVGEAIKTIQETAGHLSLFRASTQWSDTTWIAELVVQHLRPGGLLFVDYLQKVPVEGFPDSREQIMRATESLKDLAVSADISVIALAAADETGIASRRLRLDHLRGSDSLAHECDIAMVLNEKVAATADRHLRYDLTKMEQAKNSVLLSIEKNRRGQHDTHLEFTKDFQNYRLLPEGRFNGDGLYEIDHPEEL
jgi:replicative DNA helicase